MYTYIYIYNDYTEKTSFVIKKDDVTSGRMTVVPSQAVWAFEVSMG